MAPKSPRARADVEITSIDEEDSQVRDPIRSTIFHFGAAQLYIFNSLDGKKTSEEVAESASEHFEVEIPAAEVAEFVEFLRGHFLLDVGEYELNNERLRSRVQTSLARAGAIERLRAGALESGHRAEQLQHSLDALETANLNAAVSSLSWDDEASAAVLLIVQREFLRLHASTDEGWSLPLGNPDRILRVVDRGMGWLYSPLGVALLLALYGTAIAAAWGLSVPSPSEFTWLDGLLGYSLKYVLTLAGHETMGHGLAAKHYGGVVSEVGACLRNGVSVVLYCDVSGALFAAQTQRAKIVIFAAGVLADLVVASLIVLAWVWVFDGQAPRFLLVTLFFVCFSVIENSLPLRGHDGCWVLAAKLNLRELWLGDNARAYWRRRLRLEPKEDAEQAHSPREERVFAIFGVLEVLALLLFFFGLWLPFVVPIVVSYLGTVGLAIIVLPTLGYVRGRLWPLIHGAYRLTVQR